METITLGLLLLAAVLISAVIDQLIPKVSLPLIQIVMGLLIAIVASDRIDIELEPEVFLVFFIAPLLYDEAKNADRALLWRDIRPILSLVIGLVIVTALAIGFTVNALIPAIPLAAAFALGGALGPTDAVAVSSLSRQVDIPERQKSILKGELLLNDASGIVTFQFAIAVALGGTFSLAEATGDFLIEFFGGLLFGAVLGLIGNFIVRFVRSIGVENTTFHVLFEVCVPFLIYLIADACNVSGVIAVVVAGLINVISPREMVGPSISRMNIVSSNVWHVLTFALNGIVFVLLGTQLPGAMSDTWGDISINNILLIGYILIITFVLLGVRFIWTLVMEYLHVHRKEKRPFKIDDLKASLITTLSGAKGTITLTILFTIPVYMSAGERFPQRNLIIFLACGVIVCTLLIATFIVPLLAPKRELKPSEIEKKDRDVECSMEILRNVIEELNARITTKNRRATQSVIRAYNDRLARIKEDNDIKDEPNVPLRIQALQWEEERTIELMDEEKVSAVTGYQYLSRIEQMENFLEHSDGRTSLRRIWIRVRVFIRRCIHRISHGLHKNTSPEQITDMHKLQIQTFAYVIKKLDDMVGSSDFNAEDITNLSLEYQRNLSAFVNTSSSVTSAMRTVDDINDVKRFAYQYELEQIQIMYEEERLSRASARRMRENVYLMQLDLENTM